MFDPELLRYRFAGRAADADVAINVNAPKVDKCVVVVWFFNACICFGRLKNKWRRGFVQFSSGLNTESTPIHLFQANFHKR
jgi:hypothetical protein